MTDLVPVQHHAAPATIPDREFAVMVKQAEFLAGAEIIPKAYRGKPANVMVAAIVGRKFGWDAIEAMSNIHVIEGVGAVKPAALLGRVRMAGHSVSGGVSGDGAEMKATVTGRRADSGDEMTFEFSVDDAVRAGLCAIVDGKIRARSVKYDNPLPWEQYPDSMCWARACSQLLRMLFSDLAQGVSYVPEELGARVDQHGDVIDVESEEVDVSAAPRMPDQPVGDMPGEDPESGEMPDPRELLNRKVDALRLPLRSVFLHKIGAQGWDMIEDIPDDKLGAALKTADVLADDGEITKGQTTKLGILGGEVVAAGLVEDIAEYVKDHTNGRTSTRTELLKSEAGRLISDWETLLKSVATPVALAELTEETQ